MGIVLTTSSQNMIKNIIFDLGNVLINLDMPLTWNKFEILLGKNYKKRLAENNSGNVFEDYEIGAISEDEFVINLQKSSDNSVFKSQILDAWNAMLLDIPELRFTFLEKLGSKYRLFLLSNTNYTHLMYVYRYLENKHGIKDFDGRFFEKTYYSHFIAKRKPNVDIYNYVIQDAGINAHETVFIDDLVENIEGAKKAGWNAILHDPKTDIVTVWNDYSLTIDQL